MPWLERLLFVHEMCAEVGLNKFTSSTLISDHSFFYPVYFQAVHIWANFSWGQRTGKLGKNWRTCFKKRRNGKRWKKYYKKVETTFNGTERNLCPNRCNWAQSIWPNFVIPQSFQDRDVRVRYTTAELSAPIKMMEHAVLTITPTSCEDLQRMGHKLSGFYSVKGSKKMETVYCEFYPNQNGTVTCFSFNCHCLI
jgi:hypothetical protein